MVVYCSFTILRQWVFGIYLGKLLAYYLISIKRVATMMWRSIFKEGCLFCLIVLFCFDGMSQIVALRTCAWCHWKALNVSLHRLGLRMFGAMVWRLLNVKPFFHSKLNKVKTKNNIGIWGRSCYCQKAFTKLDLIDFNS
jgi:hypothetical protein